VIEGLIVAAHAVEAKAEYIGSGSGLLRPEVERIRRALDEMRLVLTRVTFEDALNARCFDGLGKMAFAADPEGAELDRDPPREGIRLYFVAKYPLR
jgi:hypothetical protein